MSRSSTTTSTSSTLFLTVGTTRFDELVNEATTLEVLSAIVYLGFTNLVIQHGNSPCNIPAHIILTKSTSDLTANPTSNATTTSSTETLSDHSHSNPPSTHNHQAELAEAMEEDGVLVAATVALSKGDALKKKGDTDSLSLERALRERKWENLKPWKKGDPRVFAEFMERVAAF
ncbi:hypothetical protein HDU76_005872 [Blyttiomyces sp. JEL0837]|nr:hypothetical protein HDU76_005872 [Blyttiomyces sp. JEL0837]